MYKLFLLLFFPVSVLATTFQIQNLDQQLHSADGVMIGHYLKSKGIKLENGMIATQMIFKMNREYGLQSDLFGMDEIIIHFPGGKVDNLRSHIEGVPEFVPGEKAALLIKNVDNRYWGLNLGMGTYKVVNYGKEVMLVNSVFPDNPKMGQIRLEDFEREVKLIKGSSLKTVLVPEYPTESEDKIVERLPASSFEEGKNRSLASQSEEDQNIEDRPSMNSLWLVAVLAFLGGLFRFLRGRTAK